MPFLRFVLATADRDSGVAQGAFQAAYALASDPGVDAADRQELSELLEWFDANLPSPSRFNRSRSKGYYRRNPRGIAWFRDDATECLSRMHRLKAILEARGYAVDVIREDRIGYVVYQDAFQVIAEPFADTRTGP